ncbi:tlp-20 [Psilogramma increta granulovirus]|uniref:Tlp-20 n=1 Tax=Psilogramma increta granulovirus TaxID=2953508 RepID=A0A977TP63_9BBAC|nr:tlp-20 [Psilogramma increta granulovirus]
MDNIVVYGDKNGVVFRSRHEYKLEKTGIPAYKLIVEEENYNKMVMNACLQVENSQYIIVMNSVVTGGCVGLLITLNCDPIVFHKDEIMFKIIINNNGCCDDNKNNNIIDNSSSNESIINYTSNDKVMSTNFSDTSAIPEFSSNGTTSKTSSVFNRYNVESRRK